MKRKRERRERDRRKRRDRWTDGQTLRRMDGREEGQMGSFRLTVERQTDNRKNRQECTQTDKQTKKIRQQF